MGDAGSMFIGLTVVWLLAMGSQSTETTTAAFTPVTALWLIAEPLIDMAGVMVRRIKKAQSPFKPDYDHLHYIFMRAGFSSREVLIIITLVSAAITAIGIGFTHYDLPEWVSLVGFLVILVFIYKYRIIFGG
jgi:UDP-GlcNAc:undecaprenyl-phosphate GlcNAc-1-phosphate transferase